MSLKRSSEIKARADQRGSVVESMDPALSGIKQQLQEKSELQHANTSLHTHTGAQQYWAVSETSNDMIPA